MPRMLTYVRLVIGFIRVRTAYLEWVVRGRGGKSFGPQSYNPQGTQNPSNSLMLDFESVPSTARQEGCWIYVRQPLWLVFASVLYR
jgi:hypothetical protein